MEQKNCVNFWKIFCMKAFKNFWKTNQLFVCLLSNFLKSKMIYFCKNSPCFTITITTYLCYTLLLLTLQFGWKSSVHTIWTKSCPPNHYLMIKEKLSSISIERQYAFFTVVFESLENFEYQMNVRDSWLSYGDENWKLLFVCFFLFRIDRRRWIETCGSSFLRKKLISFNKGKYT